MCDNKAVKKLLLLLTVVMLTLALAWKTQRHRLLRVKPAASRQAGMPPIPLPGSAPAPASAGHANRTPANAAQASSAPSPIQPEYTGVVLPDDRPATADALGTPGWREKRLRELRRRADADRAAIADLAARGAWSADQRAGVQQVRQGRVYVNEPLNVNAAISTAADQVRAQPPHGAQGAGVVIGLWDQGPARGSHRELTNRVTVVDLITVSDHATHVCGTLIATGVTSTARGMAPLARVRSYDWDEDLLEMTGDAMAAPGDTNRMPLSNHSYGVGSGWSWASTTPRWYGTWPPVAASRESDYFGLYEESARDWDQLCYESGYYLPFRAAGNDRTDYAPSSGALFYYWNGATWLTRNYVPATDPPADYWDGGYDTMLMVAVAKNVMTIGSVNDAVLSGARSLAMATITSSSSWGPTDDGRVKPDLVANGSDLYSSTSGGDAAYGTKGGTSMATPNACGSAALLVDHARRSGLALRAATLKALLIHTADDLGRAGPDYVFGWGLLNSKAAADLLTRHVAWPEAGLLREGEVFTTAGVYRTAFRWDGARPIRVTLAWTDPPGEARNAHDDRTPLLVNDLDLRVFAPDGSTNMPYVLEVLAPSNTATRGDNTLDNVEQVLIASPSMPGQYTVTVGHKGALYDDRQAFTLLIAGAGLPPTLAHTPLQNTTSVTGVYTVETTIASMDNLASNRLWVVWSTDAAPEQWQTGLLTRVTNELYRGTLPAQSLDTTVSYYLHAENTNGLTTRHPEIGAHTFEVVLPVQLMTMGSPEDFGNVSPPYGVTGIPSGSLVSAVADLLADATASSRWACVGWVGTTDIPTEGASNTVAFTMRRDSALVWRWRREWAIRHTFSAPGLAALTQWWADGATGQTATAAAPIAVGGTNWQFVEWRLDGIRATNERGVAVNPIPDLSMTRSYAADALYLDGALDTDSDAVSDWWERRYFNGLHWDDAADPDGDGYRNGEEYADRSDPADPSDIPREPVIDHTPLPSPIPCPAPWTVMAVITDNHAVTAARLRWRRVPLAWQTMAMTPDPTGGLFRALIPAPGRLGDTYEYRIEADDEAGYTAEAGVFSFTVAYPMTGLSTNRIVATAIGPVTHDFNVTLVNTGNAPYVWSGAFAPVGFADDAESGTNGWSHTGTLDRWHLSTNRAVSGNWSWYCGTTTRLYPNGARAWLDTPPWRIPKGARLTFRQWLDVEIDADAQTWDGARVEISTNAGLSFEPLVPDGGYAWTIIGHDASPWPGGTPVMAGTGGWETVGCDLAAYAGREAIVRFAFGSDGLMALEGWYLDEIAVTPRTGAPDWLVAASTGGVLAAGANTTLWGRVDAAPLVSGAAPVAAWFRLSGDDPARRTQDVEVVLGRRAVPAIEAFTVAPETNGTGRIRFDADSWDEDGDDLEIEIEISTNAGQDWRAGWLAGATTEWGVAAWTSGVPLRMTAVEQGGVGAPATNRLSLWWDTRAAPDAIDLASAVLARVRASDGVDWSVSLTSQPFLVDNEPPGPVGDLAVPGVAPSGWHTQAMVEAMWTAATDGAGAGVRGYAWALDTNPLLVAPATAMTVQTVALMALAPDGTNHWLALRAVDTYGNTGPVTRLGPLRVDTVPPDNAGAVLVLSPLEPQGYGVSLMITGAWHGFTDALSGMADYYVATGSDGSPTDGVWLAASPYVLTNPLFGATNRLSVRAQDQAGLIAPAIWAEALILAPAGDADRDGVRNDDEALAGTDATDPGSLLHLRSLADWPQPGYNEVAWPTVTGRVYSLWTVSGPLPDFEPWTIPDGWSNRPGDGAVMTYTDAVNGVEWRLYRIQVNREP